MDLLPRNRCKRVFAEKCKKYNIPRQEIEETKKQLEQYKKSLEEIIGGENSD